MVALGFMTSSVGAAWAVTADDVMNKMNSDERSSYVAGVVEGLAQTRWIADKPDPTGMRCIHDWHYKGGEENWLKIYEFFARHADKPAAALLYVMIKKDCGG